MDDGAASASSAALISADCSTLPTLDPAAQAVFDSLDDTIHDSSRALRARRVHRTAKRAVANVNCPYTPPWGSHGDAVERRLRQACALGDTAQALLLLGDATVLDVSAADHRGRTALHFSAAKGSDETVRVLLSCGADPFRKDINGNTPLHLACCCNHIRVVTLLLRHGASVASQDCLGRTPLQLAVARLQLVTSSIASGRASAQKLQSDVAEIVALLEECVVCSRDDASDYRGQLDAICNGLGATSLSATQVDRVSTLLMDFTKMQLDK